MPNPRDDPKIIRQSNNIGSSQSVYSSSEGCGGGYPNPLFG